MDELLEGIFNAGVGIWSDSKANQASAGGIPSTYSAIGSSSMRVHNKTKATAPRTGNPYLSGTKAVTFNAMPERTVDPPKTDPPKTVDPPKTEPTKRKNEWIDEKFTFVLDDRILAGATEADRGSYAKQVTTARKAIANDDKRIISLSGTQAQQNRFRADLIADGVDPARIRTDLSTRHKTGSFGIHIGEIKSLNPNNLVDYMKLNDMPFSKDDRTKLAKDLNVDGYDRSGPKNIELLEAIKKNKQQKTSKTTQTTEATPTKEISIQKDDNVSKKTEPIKKSRTEHQKVFSKTALEDYNRKKAGGGKSRTEVKRVYSKTSLADKNKREAAKIAKENKMASDAAGITTKRKQTSVGDWIYNTSKRYGQSSTQAAKTRDDKALTKRIADLLANKEVAKAKDILKQQTKK